MRFLLLQYFAQTTQFERRHTTYSGFSRIYQPNTPHIVIGIWQKPSIFPLSSLYHPSMNAKKKAIKPQNFFSRAKSRNKGVYLYLPSYLIFPIHFIFIFENCFDNLKWDWVFWWYQVDTIIIVLSFFDGIKLILS